MPKIVVSRSSLRPALFCLLMAAAFVALLVLLNATLADASELAAEAGATDAGAKVLLAPAPAATAAAQPNAFDRATDWLAARWGLLLLVLFTLGSILNAATQHWSKAGSWWSKAGLFLLDVFSIIRSVGTAPGSILGNAKVPLVPTGLLQNGVNRPFLSLLLLCLVASSSPTLVGCASTPRGYLRQALTLSGKADKLALPLIRNKCVADVDACGQVTPEQCKAYLDCSKALNIYQASMNALARELETVNKLLTDLGVR